MFYDSTSIPDRKDYIRNIRTDEGTEEGGEETAGAKEGQDWGKLAFHGKNCYWWN